MHLCSILIAAVVSVHLFGQPPKPAKDEEKIQGVWVFASGERDGKQELSDLKDRLEMEFAADAFRFHLPAGARHLQPFKLDSGPSPKTIDWLPGEKNVLLKPVQGIYKLAGDKLKICWGEQGAPRPKEFTAKAGTKQWLWVLNRKKN